VKYPAHTDTHTHTDTGVWGLVLERHGVVVYIYIQRFQFTPVQQVRHSFDYRPCLNGIAFPNLRNYVRLLSLNGVVSNDTYLEKDYYGFVIKRSSFSCIPFWPLKMQHFPN